MAHEGATIGTYRVLRKLGEGGMGAVYVAEHTLLGRKAALKVLLPALSSNHEIVQRFFNEAKAVTQISDPGIVQVFDFGYHTDGSAYIVMELLEGEALDQRLTRLRALHPLDVMRLMRQIASSLGAAHAKGIVHRDLKPENIYIVGDPAVTGGERAKILDFGIAKVSAEEPGRLKTRTGTLMGTPVYMSPEQCRGAGDIDRRSDIYSIGCVMFCMLTGRPPFDGEGAGELIAAHLREPPPLAASLVPTMPEVVDQILQQCLAKAPGDRFQTMGELAESISYAEAVLTRASTPTQFVRDPVSGAHYAATPTPPPSLRVPTPLPGSRIPTGAPAPSAPAGTLTGAAAAQYPSGVQPPRGRGMWIAIGAAVVVLGGGAAFALLHSHGDEPAAETGSGSAAAAVTPTPTPAPTPPPPPVVDAGVAAVAAVADAAVVEAPPADAAVTQPVVQNVKPHPEPHAKPKPKPTTPTTPPKNPQTPVNIDRGD